MTTTLHDTSRGWAACRAAPDELPELNRTLTMAFHDDPLFRWWMPDDRRRMQLLPGFFSVITRMYAPAGELWRTRGTVAAAVWAPPAGGPGEAEWAGAEAFSPEFSARLLAARSGRVGAQ